MRLVAVLVALLALVLVLAIGALLLVSRVPLEPLRGPLAAQLSRALGAPVEIGGELGLELGLPPRVTAGDVVFGGPPGAGARVSGRLARAAVAVALRPLLAGELELAAIDLADGSVRVEEGGAAPKAAPPSEAGPGAGAPALLASRIGRIRAEDLDVTLGGAAPIRLARASLDAQGRGKPVDVAIAGRAGDLAFDLTGSLGPFGAPGGASSIPLDLAGTVGAARVSASGDLAGSEPRGVDLGLSLSAASVGAIPGAPAALSDLGPVEGSARLRDADGSLGLEDLRIRVGRDGGPLDASASGRLDDLSALDEIELALKVRAERLSSLSAALPERGPFAFDGVVRGSADRVSAKGFRAALGSTEFTGDVSGSFPPGRRPRVAARVHTPLLHLADLGIAPSAPDGGSSGGGEPWRLPATRLPLDANVALRVDAMKGEADVFAQEFAFDLELGDGHGAVRNLKAKSAEGTISGELVFDTGESPPRVTLRSDIDHVRVHEILSQFQKVPAVTAQLFGRIDLASRGWTLAELRSALSGDFVVVAENGTASSAYVRAFERDLLRAFLDRNWKSDREFERLDCFIADFRVEHGIARSQALWLETDRVIIDGGGEVDVGREQLDLTFRPHPKRPGPVSLAARVSVTGPWGAPVVKTNKESVVTSAARALFSNVTLPGEPLLRRVWRQQPNAKNRCAEALAP